MKKLKIYLMLVCLIYANVSFSQNGWYWQNPFTPVNDNSSIFFIDENTGFLVNEYYSGRVASSLFKTTNGGSNWFQVYVPNYSDFNKIEFFNNNTGFLSGSKNILKTTNTGLNWFLIRHDPLSILTDFYTVNEGYCISDSIYKTINGGLTWSASFTAPESRLLYFLDSDIGFSIGENDARLYRTSNGGQSWTQQFTEGMYNIYFFDNNLGFASGYSQLYKTTNKGQNWIGIYSITTRAVTALSNSLFFATSTDGRIYKSTNAGINWSYFDAGIQFKSICFLNQFTGFTGSATGSFFKSTNSGTNWFSLKNGTSQNIKKFEIIDSLRSYVVGDSGLVMKTTNGGTNWMVQNSKVNYNLLSVKFINVDIGVAVGVNGTILKTADGGENWTQINNITANNLNSIDKIVNGFVAVGNNSIIIKSTNNGSNWYTVSSPTGNHNSEIQFVNSTIGYIASGNRILKSINSGESWSITPFGGYGISSISFGDESTGYAAGTRFVFPSTYTGYVYKTTDAGNNWFSLPDVGALVKVSFIDANTGFLISGGGSNPFFGIYETINGGNNWVSLTSIAGWGFYLYDAAFLNYSTGWVVGNGGIVVKTTDCGNQFVGNIQINEQLPLSFSLSQNYPNPFNPQTKIKFAVPKTSFTTIIVYDLLGREVTILVNDELKPGTYEADWDGSNFSSGVYFYKIIAGHFVETKKMVLMK